MKDFEQIVLDVYRASRELSSDSFQTFALTCLCRALNAESAVWGSGHNTGGALVASHLALLETSKEAAVECAALKARDKVIPTVLHRMGRTCAFHAPTLFSAPDDRPMREYAMRWGRQSWLVTAIGDSNPALVQWISLYRPDPDHHFEPGERALFERLMPHLREAFGVNLALMLGHLGAGGDQAEPRALIDSEGWIRSASPDLAELLALEWTGFGGRRVPAELRRRAPPAGAWTYVGRHVCADCRKAGEFTAVRLRRKCTLDTLSPRQSEVARSFADGLTHKEIARRMGVTPATVRNHLAKAYHSLAVSSRAELRRLASHRSA